MSKTAAHEVDDTVQPGEMLGSGSHPWSVSCERFEWLRATSPGELDANKDRVHHEC